MPPAKSVRGKNARTGASQLLKFIALKFWCRTPESQWRGILSDMGYGRWEMEMKMR
jgi:hypothetical protein